LSLVRSEIGDTILEKYPESESRFTKLTKSSLVLATPEIDIGTEVAMDELSYVKLERVMVEVFWEIISSIEESANDEWKESEIMARFWFVRFIIVEILSAFLKTDDIFDDDDTEMASCCL
jgi:hypothetical protein